MEKQFLYMVMLGCTPKGRLTEQHDIFFGIGSSLKELVPQMNAFWPEVKGKIHIDAWRKISTVEGYKITIEPKSSNAKKEEQLFFLNLGGYNPGEFEEYHYKIVTVAPSKAVAIKKSKQTLFFKHCGFKGAESHIDDKFCIDIDDMHIIQDVLPAVVKASYQIHIEKALEPIEEDELHIGYVKIKTLTI